MKKALKTMGKAAKRLLTAVLLVACCALLLNTIVQRLNGNPLPTILGWGAAIVQTGSMEPNIPIGSLILIQEQNTYQPGEVITYRNGNNCPVTHRVVSITDGTIVTQGDANNIPDVAFDENRIIGKVRIVLPEVGAFLLKIREPHVLLGITTVLLAWWIISNIIIQKGNVENEI